MHELADVRVNRPSACDRAHDGSEVVISQHYVSGFFQLADWTIP